MAGIEPAVNYALLILHGSRCSHRDRGMRFTVSAALHRDKHLKPSSPINVNVMSGF